MAITPNPQGIRQCTATQQLYAEVLLALKGLLGKLAIKPDAPFPALDCYGGKALPDLSCKVSTNEVSSIPVLEGKNNGIHGSFFVGCQFFAPWYDWRLIDGVCHLHH
jgi:hypothetical protein